MKTLKGLFLLVVLLTVTPFGTFGQVRPERAKQDSSVLKYPDTPEKGEKLFLKIRQGDQEKKIEIERAVFEIQFNQMVDEIDRRFHTPPSLPNQTVTSRIPDRQSDWIAETTNE